MCVNECSRPTNKETDTLHRSKLSPRMIQILNFTYHSERLDFNNGWVSKEAELTVIDATPDGMEIFMEVISTYSIVDALSDSDNDFDYT